MSWPEQFYMPAQPEHPVEETDEHANTLSVRAMQLSMYGSMVCLNHFMNSLYSRDHFMNCMYSREQITNILVSVHTTCIACFCEYTTCTGQWSLVLV